jgi:hypothetical protein
VCAVTWCSRSPSEHSASHTQLWQSSNELGDLRFLGGMSDCRSVLEPDRVDVCYKDPGYPVDLYVMAPLKTLAADTGGLKR